MSNTQNAVAPDAMDWHESAIIVKAVAIIGTAFTGFIISMLSVFGVNITDALNTKIGAAVASFLALAAAIGIVWNRFHQRFCPPINPIIKKDPTPPTNPIT